MCQVDCHRPQQAFSQHQHKTVRREIFVFPTNNLRQVYLGWNGVNQHPTLAFSVSHFYDGNIQGCLDRCPVVLPFCEGNALISKLPDCYPGMSLVTLFAKQLRNHPGMIGKANALQLILCHPLAERIEQQVNQCRTAQQQINWECVGHACFHHRREQLNASGV